MTLPSSSLDLGRSSGAGNSGSNDVNFPFETLGEDFADSGPDGWDEEKEADGVGEEAGRDEDSSSEEES